MMSRRLRVSNVLRAGKRAVAVAVIGVLLGVLAAPATSSASTHATAHSHGVVQPDDGVGDSPVVP